MADKVKTEGTYQVGTGDVFLSLTIGEGQFGTSDVSVGGTKLLRASGPIGSLRLGAGPAIAGKKLVVQSVVSDVSTVTDRMSVTYRLSGGRSRKTIVSRGSVARQGEMLVFDTTIVLS